MFTEWPGIYSYEELNDRLFLNPGRNDNIHDTQSRVRWNSPEHLAWVRQQMYMAQFVGAQLSQVTLTMTQTMTKFESDLAEEEQEIQANKRSGGFQVKRWKTKQGIFQLKDPTPMEQVEPGTDDATYAEVLRDV